MNIEERLKQFDEALSRKYKAAVFDIDGTLAEKNVERFPDSVLDELAQLSERIPLAVCTGRAIDMVGNRLDHVFERCANKLLCRKNWFALCENGSIGYVCEDGENFREFYREHFPFTGAKRKLIFDSIASAMGDKAGDCFQNLESLIFRPAERNGFTLEQCSRELYEIAGTILADLAPEGQLIAVDAGMGIAVISPNGNKDRGLKEMAMYLREKHGMDLGPDSREIVVIGDQGGPGGNDEALLNGLVGTPFTVGTGYTNRIFPIPVFCDSTVLKGPEATVNLLQRLQFSGTI